MKQHEEEQSKAEGKKGSVATRVQSGPAVPGRARTVMDLQRAAGNQAVSRMFGPRAGASTATIQRHLEPEDLQEIDQLLDRKLEERGATSGGETPKTEGSSPSVSNKPSSSRSSSSYISKDDPKYWQKMRQQQLDAAKPLEGEEKKAKEEYDAQQKIIKKQQAEQQAADKLEEDRQKVEERLGLPKGTAATWNAQKVKEQMAFADRKERRKTELLDLRSQVDEFSEKDEEAKEKAQEELAAKKWDAQKKRNAAKIRGRMKPGGSMYNWG